MPVSRVSGAGAPAAGPSTADAGRSDLSLHRRAASGSAATGGADGAADGLRVVTDVLRLSGLSAGYDGRPVLRGIDLRVQRGDVVAVLGPNGSGKTTLLRAVLGLVPRTGGTLELFGTPAHAFTDWSRIGWVPQRTGAASGVPATVREIVSSGRLPRLRRLRRMRPADRAAVDWALETVGLAALHDRDVATLSGGQQQRVLIARALAGEPDLLVLDEPTSGVDLDSQRALAEGLGGLREQGVTIVLVAHELGPMAGLIDRAVVLRAGAVVHDGPPPTVDFLHAVDPEHAHPPHHGDPAAPAAVPLGGGGPLGVRRPGAPLPGAPLPGAPLPGAPLPGAPLPGVPLPGVPLPGVPLPGVPLPARGWPS